MTATAVQLSRRGPAIQLAEADRSRGLVLDRAPRVCVWVCACMCVCRRGQDAGGITSPDAAAVEPCRLPPRIPLSLPRPHRPPSPRQARHAVTSLGPPPTPPCNNLSLIRSDEWRRAKSATAQPRNQVCDTRGGRRVGGGGPQSHALPATTPPGTVTSLAPIVRLLSGQVTPLCPAGPSSSHDGPFTLDSCVRRGHIDPAPPTPLRFRPPPPRIHYTLQPTNYSLPRSCPPVPPHCFLPLSHSPAELSPVPGPSGQTGSHNALGDIERSPLPTTGTPSTHTHKHTPHSNTHRPSPHGFGVSIRLPAHK